MKKQLLIETIPVAECRIEEVFAEDKPYLMRVTAVSASADEVNGNNRLYPYAIMEREVGKLQKQLESNPGSIFEEADHPDDGVSRVRSTCSLLKSIKLDPQTKQVVTESLICKTAVGRDLAAIIQAGGKPGRSSRGYGSLKSGQIGERAVDIVQSDYSMSTIDFVIGQSTPNAVVTQFEQQTQGSATGAEMIDYTKVSLEDLRNARPDLLSALEKELTTKVEQAFDAKVTAKVTEMVDAKTKEIETSLTAKFEADKVAAIEKAKQEGSDKTESDKVKILGTQLSETTTQLKNATDRLAKLEEGERKVAVHAYIVERTKDQPFRTSLTERLVASCNSKEDVDAKFESEKKFIQGVLDEHTTAGKGNSQRTEEPGAAANAEKNVTTKSGLKITEQESRQRELAGVKG